MVEAEVLSRIATELENNSEVNLCELKFDNHARDTFNQLLTINLRLYCHKVNVSPDQLSEADCAGVVSETLSSIINGIADDEKARKMAGRRVRKMEKMLNNG